MEDIMKMLTAISEAKTEPSPTCSKADEHSFVTVSHMDGRDSYTWVYRCEHCDEYVKKEQKRKGMDKKLWA